MRIIAACVVIVQDYVTGCFYSVSILYHGRES